DRRLVRNALCEAGAAQPARTGLLGGLPPPEPGVQQLRCPRAAVQTRGDPAGRGPGPARMARRLPPPVHSARSRGRVRPGGGPPLSLRGDGPATGPPTRRIVCELVSHCPGPGLLSPGECLPTAPDGTGPGASETDPRCRPAGWPASY